MILTAVSSTLMFLAALCATILSVSMVFAFKYAPGSDFWLRSRYPTDGKIPGEIGFTDNQSQESKLTRMSLQMRWVNWVILSPKHAEDDLNMCRLLILDMFHELYTRAEGVVCYCNQDVVLLLMWIIHDLGIFYTQCNHDGFIRLSIVISFKVVDAPCDSGEKPWS